MPELPEVEIVVRNLNDIIKPGHKLTAVKLWRKDIRYPIPDKLLQAIISSPQNKVVKIYRRAKFIVLEFADYFIISHLGMTGSWTTFKGNIADYSAKKHDHLALGFGSKLWLIYNDPRRFGFVHVVRRADVVKYFSNYGFEPLQMTNADVDSLYQVAKKSKSPLKSFIMNQKNVVGVGNIYACEALFMAGISPFRLASQLKKESFEKLIKAVQKNLNMAIQGGGSSIKNYRNVKEEKGNFQQSHLVYGKENKKCPRCHQALIKRKVQAGRSTFFCSACQR